MKGLQWGLVTRDEASMGRPARSGHAILGAPGEAGAVLPVEDRRG